MSIRAAARHWPLAPVLILAAGLFSVGLIRPGDAPIYEVTAHAMTVSWRAFWYGTVDPAGTLTLDKTPGFLWPQALLARVFGFHLWVLVLPQVLEGLIAVAALYRLVQRPFGRLAGTVAALAFTLTPIVASAYGHSTEDCLLITCLLLAALCWQWAELRGGWWPLYPAALFVALGFQAKMVEAWLVLIPIGISMLLAGMGSIWLRLGRLTFLGTRSLALSLVWAAVVAITPSHPFADGTTDGNVFTMIFGYNGLSRFGVTIHGALGYPSASNNGWTDHLFWARLYSQ